MLMLMMMTLRFSFQVKFVWRNFLAHKYFYNVTNAPNYVPLFTGKFVIACVGEFRNRSKHCHTLDLRMMSGNKNAICSHRNARTSFLCKFRLFLRAHNIVRLLLLRRAIDKSLQSATPPPYEGTYGGGDETHKKLLFMCVVAVVSFRKSLRHTHNALSSTCDCNKTVCRCVSV